MGSPAEAEEARHRKAQPTHGDLMSVDVSKVLREEKIELRSIKFGNQYALCPQCSHTRKGAHKKLKCLSVKIDASGVCWNCKNCQWVGSENAEREAREGDRRQRPEPRKGGGYGALQRASLARWANRS
jgi:rubredoxin